MKTIGLLGGMSWESTVPYYQIVNETVKEKLGGLHSAKLLLYSVDFAEIEECQARGEWEKSAEILGKAARGLQEAGADFLVICTNTMHKVAPQIQEQISMPILQIGTAALLGTKYTMTQDFYKEKLVQRGIQVLVPEEEEIEAVNWVIYEELCRGIISDESRKQYVKIIENLKEKGAQGVILGCTEIGLLVKQEDSPLPVFDTTAIHGYRAAMEALKD